jgi:MSHA biogenesis protein MshE
MGAAGYMIAAAVHGIVAQRLVRQVCTDCAQPVELDPHQSAWLQAQVGAARASKLKFRAGAGCTYCNLSGYRGRMAIYELVEIDRPLADAIRRGDLIEFASAARSRPGYTSLTHSALELASRGLTTIAEVIGVTSGLDQGPDLPVEDADESLVSDAILSGRLG